MVAGLLGFMAKDKTAISVPDMVKSAVHFTGFSDRSVIYAHLTVYYEIIAGQEKLYKKLLAEDTGQDAVVEAAKNFVSSKTRFAITSGSWKGWIEDPNTKKDSKDVEPAEDKLRLRVILK